MNKHNISEIDVTRSLPPTLKQDPDMVDAAQVIGGQLQENVRLSRLNLIYHRIDELDEEKLDILAYDLHVDWYDYSYPIDAKRRIIKDSVKVHKYLGTRYAVETALGNLFPNSHVEEWYEYGGRPFYFRAVLDVTNSDVESEYAVIKRTVELYKRLTAHLEDIVYQGSAIIEIGIETQAFVYATDPTTGYPAGTRPFPLTAGGQAGDGLVVVPEGGGYGFSAPKAGTRPLRNRLAALQDTVIIAQEEGHGFPHTPGLTGEYNAGTRPARAVFGGSADGGLTLHPDPQGFGVSPPLAGTVPDRSQVGGAVGDGVNVQPATQGFDFASPPAGTRPDRATPGGGSGGGLAVEPDPRGYGYTPPAAGTVPDRKTGSGADRKGVSASTTAEGFKHQIKRCGTDITKNQ